MPNVAIEYRRSGTLQVARTDDESRQLEKERRALVDAGVPHSYLDGSALKSLEPALAEDVCSGLLIPEHGYVGVATLVSALTEAAGRAGATLSAAKVLGVSTAAGSVRVETSEGTLTSNVVGARRRQLVWRHSDGGSSSGAGTAHSRAALAASLRAAASVSRGMGRRRLPRALGRWSPARGCNGRRRGVRRERDDRRGSAAARVRASVAARGAVGQVRGCACGAAARHARRVADHWRFIDNARRVLRHRALSKRRVARAAHSGDGGRPHSERARARRAGARAAGAIRAVKLKKHYTSREVAVLTGLTARQLQWWDTRRLFKAALAAAPNGGRWIHRTALHAARCARTAGAGRSATPRFLRAAASAIAHDAARPVRRAPVRGDRRRRRDDAFHCRRSAVRANEGRAALQPGFADAAAADGGAKTCRCARWSVSASAERRTSGSEKLSRGRRPGRGMT